MIVMSGKPEPVTRDVETIIREGRELGHSARMIADEVERFFVEKAVQYYIDNEQSFFGRASLVKFRNFITKSIQNEKREQKNDRSGRENAGRVPEEKPTPPDRA